ncbi:hypothetical protein SAMN02949497_1621 [Methylomagnum ishizawai]|uniref:Uncharacterized protein n=1 Tax=Methylomagnum ishizawai TaxID=1760988 RepID=A0A1Y6CV81_9GAMM|nr:hypothetical protein [Methylomagnum ishizawai]SMF94311.1 hypothetical protein SAMN02949497_1621 [Methylomagnum ishizawai]
MNAEDFETWREGIVAELIDADAKLAAESGPYAGQWLAIQLGLSDGDIVMIDDNGDLVLKTPKDEIDRRIAALREALANGGSALDFPWPT